MSTALPTASSAYAPDRPSAVATVDNATPQGSTYHRGNSVQMNGAGSTICKRAPWNKGNLFGQKPPLKPKDIWAIRIYLQNAHVGKIYHKATSMIPRSGHCLL